MLNPGEHHIMRTHPLQQSSDGCYITEIGGFLKYRCPSNTTSWLDETEVYKCHSSDELYTYDNWNWVFDSVCSNDPHYYQACDTRLTGYELTNSDILCGNWMCTVSSWGEVYIRATMEMDSPFYCDGSVDCDNELDETNCGTEAFVHLSFVTH